MFLHLMQQFLKKLIAAGGNALGKTNMDAWAHGSSTETSDYGTTKIHTTLTMYRVDHQEDLQ